MDESEPITKDDLQNALSDPRGLRLADLPDEVQTEDFEKTGCEYCGVSYFLLTEMRELQARVDRAEAQVENWRDRIANVTRVEGERDEAVARLDREVARRRKERAERAKAQRYRAERLKESCGALSGDLDGLRQTLRSSLEGSWVLEVGEAMAARLVEERTAGERLVALIRAEQASVELRHAEALRRVEAERGEALRLEVARVEEVGRQREAELERSYARESTEQSTRFRMELVALEARNGELLREVSAAQTRVDEAQRLASELREEVRVAKDDGSSVRREMAGLVRDLMAARGELEREREASSRARDELEREREAAARALNKAQTAHRASEESRSREERQAREAAEGLLEHLRESVAEGARREKELHDTIEHLQDELKRGKDGEAAAMARAKEKEDELWRVTTRHAAELERVKEEGSKTIAESIARAVAVREAEVAAASQKELVAHQGRWRAEVDRVQKDLASAIGRADSAERERDELALRCGELRGEVREQTEQTARVHAELVAIREEIQMRASPAADVSAVIEAVLKLLDPRDESMSRVSAVLEAGRDAAALQRGVEQLLRALGESRSQVQELEAIVEQECAERTFLLSELNDLRSASGRAELSLDEVRRGAVRATEPPASARRAGSTSSLAGAGSRVVNDTWTSGRGRAGTNRGRVRGR
jgi:chromosome segregation ATPase